MKRVALFVFGLAVVVGLVWYAGAGAVGRALGVLGPFGLLAIALLHLPTIALMGVAWWSVRGQVQPGTLRKFLTARLIRDAASEVLPFSQLGGFAIGARALARSGVDLFRGALSMFADLVMEFAAKLPYTLIGLVLLFVLRPGAPLVSPLAAGVALALSASVAAYLFRKPLLALLVRTALAVVRRWTSLAPRGDVGPAVAAAFAARSLLTCFGIHLVCWLLGACETWVIFRLLGTSVTLAQAVVVDSLANGLRTFAFFIPAAAGAQEGAYVLVSALFGLSPASAVAFSLARRARELVLGVPGLAAWQVLESRLLSRAVQIVGGKAQPPA